MNKKIIMLAAVTFILAACRVEVPLPKNSAANQKSAEDLTANAVGQDAFTPEVSTEAIKCPSQDFEIFLTSFINSVEVQKSFTATPLESVTIDALAEPEPAEVKKMLVANKLMFPLMPSPDQQANEGLKSRRSGADENNVEVILFKPDTDYQTSFFFKRLDCWNLIRIKDYSL